MKRWPSGNTIAWALALALAWSACPVWAQQPRFETAEAAVEAMNKAMQAGDWKAAAAIFDTQAIKDFRAMLMPVIDGLPQDQADAMVKTIFAAPSAASLRKQSDAEFFSGFMGGLMAMAGGKIEDTQVIGSVTEGESTRHVVVRNRVSAMGLSMTKMEVVSALNTPQGWRLQLKGDMKGMAETMARRLRATPKAD